MKNKGLRGVDAGETSICSVGKKSDGLHYRGYNVADLSENCSFEEVAYLLLYKKLPNKGELRKFKSRLKSKRYIPEQLKEVLERIPKDNNPMDVLRTASSFLGNLEPEKNFDNQFDCMNNSEECYWMGDHCMTGSNCTDPVAYNYNPIADILGEGDDSSCQYSSFINFGCTYEGAINFNQSANVDDGSCEFMYGDVNTDGIINILDIIEIVNIIID